jgi:hypothetical protein
MRQRCLNPKNKDYENYGGKGITICDEWIDDPVSFYNWAIKSGYREGLEIDRENANGNYCLQNCRWITKTENVGRKNKDHSKNIMCVETGAVYESLTGAAKLLKVQPNALFHALNHKTKCKKFHWSYVAKGQEV